MLRHPIGAATVINYNVYDRRKVHQPRVLCYMSSTNEVDVLSVKNLNETQIRNPIAVFNKFDYFCKIQKRFRKRLNERFRCARRNSESKVESSA